MNSTDGSTEPRRKRRRVDPAHQACTECKQRKVRCDAARPACSTCVSGGKPCDYPPVYRRATCSQRHVDDLEAKLKEYEQQLSINANQRQHNPTSGSKDGRAVPLSPPELVVNGRINANSHFPANIIRSAISDRSSPIVSDNEDSTTDDATALPAIDGMVEYISPNDSHVSDAGFEDASTFRFANNLTATRHDRSVQAEDAEGGSVLASSQSQPVPAYSSPATIGLNNIWRMDEPPKDGTHDDCITALKSYMDQSSLSYLPQRHVASALLEKYFSIILPTWPFLVEKRVRQQFNNTWLSDEPPNPMWLAQLNLIFAIACELYDTSDDSPMPNIFEAGKMFYLRANGFVIANCHRICSIPMVQILLLAAQYQQGTLRTNEHWMTIGIATRMCLGLGLDRIARGEYGQQSSLSALDKEICKRLWWTCFSFDRLSSMVYGRPVGIASMPQLALDQELVSPTDDKYLDEDLQQPNEVPSVNAFFANTVKLYRIMDEILVSLPARSQLAPSPLTNRTTSNQSYDAHRIITQLNTIFEIDALLIEWHQNLPAHLAFSLESLDDTSPSLPYIFRLHRIVLKLRFLGMRILLHRQSLLLLLQGQENQSRVPNTAQRHITRVDTQLARVSASICTQMAQLQIETIDANRPLKMTGAWWWNLHFVFNSLCVLFGALAVPAPEDIEAILPDPNRNKAAIRRGLDNIRTMASRGGPRVVQTERFLRGLLRAMIKRRHQQNQPASTQATADNSNQRGCPAGHATQPALASDPSGLSNTSTAIRSDNDGRYQQTQAMEQTKILPNLDKELGDLDVFELLPADAQSSSFSTLDDMNIDWSNGLPSNVLDPDLASMFLQDSFNAWADPTGAQSMPPG
ncbi:hypothetical protein PRZ48_002885 [Zasmidium cellare]|uniref:Zn(2)-C6 fungal-type domain-containing protein n=1 Tax=Zasmidium cellare TaxID=395010 RepID=A0ABR0ETV1_ZASCE|nr:hypothetical protein PRZ48_002885 [Zasmidium cellare]